jgi:very-short-patch-repair endonuclease
MQRYNKNLRQFSRQLRSNMTDAEKLLWSKVRGKQLKGYQFYRQKIIGNYIADFCCPKANLVIEIDGGQHYSDEGKKKDSIRDGYMVDIGLKVLRFSDRDIFENVEGVIETIWTNL